MILCGRGRGSTFVATRSLGGSHNHVISRHTSRRRAKLNALTGKCDFDYTTNVQTTLAVCYKYGLTRTLQRAKGEKRGEMSRCRDSGGISDRVIGRTTDAREVTARVVSVKHFISNIKDLLCRLNRGLSSEEQGLQALGGKKKVNEKGKKSVRRGESRLEQRPRGYMI